MKSVFLAFLCASLFAFTQATEVTQTVGDCQVGAFLSLVTKEVNTTYNFYNGFALSYEHLYLGVLDCFESESDPITCVGDVVTTWIEALGDTFVTYATGQVAIFEVLAQDIADCSQY